MTAEQLAALGLRLVPTDLTSDMRQAMDEMYMPFGAMAAAWDGALSAAPALTDAQVDALCRAWFGEDGVWDRSIDAELQALDTPSSGHCEGLRNDDRAHMRAFIAAINGAQP